jgi:glycosyltransferase involved in cell wall biosynthesis
MNGVPLLVFADDWGRHPSSCQHLTRRLLSRHETLWVNTIGTRPPRLDRTTVRRALGKLRQWLTARDTSGAAEPSPRVLNPRMWPWFRRPFDRRLNRRLLLRQLLPALRALPQLPVAVTTLPIIADLMGELPVRRWVYYCVDDFAEWPGLDGDTLRRMEEVVVRKADIHIAVSETLAEKLAAPGRCVHQLTHGVDLAFWKPPSAPLAVPLPNAPRPWVLFWGVIDRRMDVEFLARLAHELPEGSIVLAGPEEEPDPRLRTLPRVVRLGPLPFEHLPVLAGASEVLIMPYADLPVTRAMQPLKLKEYLATGKPVVVRDLPATRPWSDCLDLAGTPAAFAQAVCLRSSGAIPEAQRKARQVLAEESWDAKALLFEQWALSSAVPSPAAPCA